MICKVIYTSEAKEDLRNIFSYCTTLSTDKEIAKKKISKILKAIASLDHMPLRHRLCKYEPWLTQGLRKFPIDNYIVFYLPAEKGNRVYIMRVMHSSRNYQAQFTNKLSDNDVIYRAF